MANFKGTVHFFANQTDLPLQSVGEKFGPVVGAETTKFRVTSKFTGSATGAVNTSPMSLAVTDGRVFIVLQNNDSGATQINLVLKPTDQLKGFPRVKYFIYRGLLKSDFLDANNAIIATASTNSDLIKLIHSGRDSNQAVDVFASLSGNTPMDNLFIDADIVLQDVKKGTSLGRFDGGAAFYGFEIMLDEPGFTPDMDLARKEENIIDLAALSGEALIKNRLQCLNYIDPAAWYGLFLRPSTTNYTDREYHSTFYSVGSHFYTGSTLKNDDRSFENLSIQLISKFATKRTLYIDLRNDAYITPDVLAGGFTDVKYEKGGSSSAHSGTPVSIRSFNWPLLIIEGGFTTQQTKAFHLKNSNQSKTLSYYNLKISFPRTNFPNALVRLFHGAFSKYHVFNLPKVKFLRLPESSSGSGWTSDLNILCVAENNQQPCANYFKIQYQSITSYSEIEHQVPGNYSFDYQSDKFNGYMVFGAYYLPPLLNITIPNKTSIIACGHGGGYAAWFDKGFSAAWAEGIDPNGYTTFCYRDQKAIYDASDVDEFDHDFRALEHDRFHKRIINLSEETITISTELRNETSIWEILSQYSKYKPGVIEDPTLKTHSIRLASNPNVFCLEPRIIDPLIIRGVDLSPLDPLISISISSTEADIVRQYITNSFSTVGPKFLIPNNAQIIDENHITKRKYFKAVLRIKGLIYNNSSSTHNWLDGDMPGQVIELYSINGLNWFSHAYASAYHAQSNGTLWDNNHIPDLSVFGTGSYNSSIQTNITNLLNGLVKLDKKIFNTELRDYIYAANLDSLSFHIAFGMPFHCIDKTIISKELHAYPETPSRNYYYYIDLLYKKTPTNTEAINIINTYYGLDVTSAIPMTVPTGSTLKAHIKTHLEAQGLKDSSLDIDTKSIWMPYIENHANFFAIANTLRSLASPLLPSLLHDGLTRTINNTSDELYTLFKIKKADFTNTTPAYIARACYDENPKNLFINNDTDKPHLPLDDKVQFADTYSQAQLTNLQTAGIISTSVKTALQNLADADTGYAEINFGSIVVNTETRVYSSANSKYIIKNSNPAGSKQYTIYRTSSTGDSGITFGMGYDIGQRSNFNDFKNNTQYYHNTDPWSTKLAFTIKKISSTGAVSNVTKESIVQLALGVRGNSAYIILKTFWEGVWKELVFDYYYAIEKAGPLMKEKYLDEGLSSLYTGRTSDLQMLKVYQQNTGSGTEFYENNGVKFANPLEIMEFLSVAYNAGPGSVQISSKPKTRYNNNGCRLLQAINTHSLQWLKSFNLRTVAVHTRVAALDKIYGTQEVINFYKKR